MVVSLVRIENLRNLKSVEVSLGRGFTLVSGLNGAGKTTLLEALYLVSRGRTFRGRKAGDFTTRGSAETKLEALVEIEGEGLRRWEYRRSRGAVSRTVDSIPLGETVGKRFLVRLVGENPQLLFDAEPSLRRRFLDWNMFHVEPGYGAAWVGFRRLLRQRNASLRSTGACSSVWDREFCIVGEHLTELRARFFNAWVLAFAELKSHFPFAADLDLVPDFGWNRLVSLSDALRSDREGERRVGFTRVGPGRADYRILRDGSQVGLSRGQIKVLVCLLQLAARNAMLSLAALRSVWLLDDLSSDLDRHSKQALVDLFSGTGDQLLLTAIGGREHAGTLPDPEAKLFHVEQGTITPLP